VLILAAVEKLMVKKLRGLGTSKLAEAAKSTINGLREIGAPDISEDQVITSILKEAAKSNVTTIDLAGRANPSATPALGMPRYSFCVLVSFCRVGVRSCFCD
jgi:hypothetical protein